MAVGLGVVRLAHAATLLRWRTILLGAPALLLAFGLVAEMMGKRLAAVDLPRAWRERSNRISSG
jgi:hypothetical protein